MNVTEYATEKPNIVRQFRTHESDTGSPEVQVALLTRRSTERYQKLIERLGLRK